MTTRNRNEPSTAEKTDQPLATIMVSDQGNIVSYFILLVFVVIYLGPLLMLVNTSLKTQSIFMRDATAPATTSTSRISRMPGIKPTFRNI